MDEQLTCGGASIRSPTHRVVVVTLDQILGENVQIQAVLIHHVHGGAPGSAFDQSNEMK